MFKVMTLMKRKNGTSMQDLIDYYENHHTELGINFWKETKLPPKGYRRKYLHPFPDLQADTTTGMPVEPAYDVAMEMSFDCREDFDKFMENGMSERVMKMFSEDELKFLDREKTANFIVEEHETDLADRLKKT